MLLLLRKVEQNRENITKLVREFAILNSQKTDKNYNNKIIFLIRAYNEEKHIEEVIRQIKNAGFDNIIIVDDGSIDTTYKNISKFKNIIYLKHIYNRWPWAALETGFEYIRRNKKWLNYIVTFDADLQHNIEDLKKFIKEFNDDKKLDIVLWSRFITKTDTNVPFIRKMILISWKFFTYLLSWIYLTDSHNGYRMIKIEAIDKIKLTMDGMEYASELVEQIKKNNLTYKEVPVNIKYTKYSLEKWQKSINALRIARKVIWNKFFR